MAQHETRSKTASLFEDNKTVTGEFKLKETITKLLLLTQDIDGKTISECYINTNVARFQEIRTEQNETDLWYNDPVCGAYLVDSSDEIQMTMRPGHGLAIKTHQ